jgi:hypothetical protein
MENRAPRDDAAAKRLIDRLDRAAQDMNAVLIVLALGLAALDATCFVAFEVRDSVKTGARISADASLAMPVMAAAQSPTAPAPNKPALNPR